LRARPTRRWTRCSCRQDTRKIRHTQQQR
jgi:hypothetical protein